MTGNWLVFVKTKPGVQLHKIVVAPDYRALGLTAFSHWKPLNPEEPDGIRRDDLIWFFLSGSGIEKLCRVSDNCVRGRPHPAAPEHALSLQYPVEVIASFSPIRAKEFARTYHDLRSGGGNVPVDEDGRFRMNVYCHSLPDPVARELARLADSKPSKRQVRPPSSSVIDCLNMRSDR